MKQRQRGIGMTFWKYLIRALEVASQTWWFYSLGFCFAETYGAVFFSRSLGLQRDGIAPWWWKSETHTILGGARLHSYPSAWIYSGGALKGKWGVWGSRTGTGEAEHGMIKPQAWHAACCACNNAPPVLQSGEVNVGECARITQKWCHTKKWTVSGTTSCPLCC